VAAPLLLLAIPFFALALAVTLQGMSRGSSDWLSPLLAAIVHPNKRFWGRVLHLTLLPFGPLKVAALNAYYAVLHTLSHAAAHALAYVTHFLHGLLALERAYQDALVRFELAVAHGFEVGFGNVLPREIGQATRPISRRAERAWKKAAAAAAAAAAARHWFAHLYGHVIRPAIHHLSHAVDVAIPHSLAGLRHRIRDVETQLSRPTRRWLRRIAAAMWLAYLAGAVTRLLARRFPWLFCRKVGNVGRTVCSLNADLFEAIISVVRFADELEHFFNSPLPGLDESPREIVIGGIGELADLPPGEYL
jgi:hypothetical protein